MATFEINNGKEILIASDSDSAAMNIQPGTAPTSPNDGDLWLSTNPGLFAQIGGRSNRLASGIYSQINNVSVANTTTETTFINSSGAAGSVTIPSTYWSAGRTFNIEGWGHASQLSADTLTLRIKVGSTTIYAPSITTIATFTNQLIYIRCILTCISTGASGVFRAQGFLSSSGIAISNQNINTSDFTINTTASLDFNLTAQHSSASASSTVTLTNIQIKN
jgi:hypothetical protein